MQQKIIFFCCLLYGILTHLLRDDPAEYDFSIGVPILFTLVEYSCDVCLSGERLAPRSLDDLDFCLELCIGYDGRLFALPNVYDRR